jgi:glutamine cyclotransferase
MMQDDFPTPDFQKKIVGYKLIKKFPYSAKVGTVYMQDDESNFYSSNGGSSCELSISHSEIIEHPEFFEHVYEESKPDLYVMGWNEGVAHAIKELKKLISRP